MQPLIPEAPFAQSPDHAAKSRRSLFIGLGVLGALLALAVAAAVLIRLQYPTPADQVDGYLTALQRGEFEKAFSYLSESSKRAVGSPTQMSESAIGGALRNGLVESFKIGKTSASGESSSVEVKVTAGATETVMVMTTVKEGGRWKVQI